MLHDAIRRALRPSTARPSRVPLRRRRPRPDGRPGAADARRGRALHGRAAGARAGPGGQHAPELRAPLRGRAVHGHVRGARHPTRDLLDERAATATARWTPTSARALDQRGRDPRDLPARSATSSSRPAGCRSRVICENCGRIGTTLATDWDGATVAYDVPARPTSTWATGCGHTGRVAPFGGRAKLAFNVDWAAKWGLVRRHASRAAARTSPRRAASRDRSRCHQPRGLRPRAAAQRALRVPQHRRPQDEHLARGAGAAAHEMAELLPARAAALPVPAPQAAQARIEFDPEGDTIPRALRRVRPGRRLRSPGQPVARRAAARPRAHLPGQPRRRRRRRGRRGRPVPAGVPPPRAARPGPGRGPRGAHGGREGRAARRGRAGHPRRARARRPGLAGGLRARPLPGRGPGRAARRGRGARPRRSGVFLADLADAAEASAPPRATPGRTSSSAPPSAAACRRAMRSRRVYAAFLGRANGPRAGWLLASLDRGVRRLGRLRDARRVRRRRRAARPDHERRAAAPARRRRDASARAPSRRARTRRSSTRPSRSTRGAARLLGEADALRAERKHGQRAHRRGHQGRRGAQRPEVAALRAQSTELGARIDELDARRRARSRPSSRSCCCASPTRPIRACPVGGEEASVIVRTWGEPAAHEPTRMARPGAGRTGRSPRRWACIDLAAGAKVAGSGFPLYRGAGRGPPARAHRLLPRPPHPRARHDRDLAAGRRQRRFRARHRADPGQGRPDVRRHARRAVPGARPRRCRSRTSTATRSSRRTGCPSATSPTRPASDARPAPPAPRRAASCASTSSTRSRWSASSGPPTPTRRSSG